MEDSPLHSFFISSTSSAKITSWNVALGDKVRRGTVLLSYTLVDPMTPSLQSDSAQVPNCPTEKSIQQLKSTLVGVVRETLYGNGEVVPPSAPVVSIEKKCDHSVVVFELCTDCGLNLRKDKSGPRPRPGAPSSDRISMVHGNPEIQISRAEAEILANKDKSRLLQSRKLALIIDLDQTLIHTSVDPNIEPGLPDVYGFRLPGHPVLYHCRLRPFARQFLLSVSKYYETHVFTMGTKVYAASVTNILDPDKKLFYGRIISRDDCFDPHSKALRLKSVFPCGDAMVAIIDDREDVWGRCPNLIHVKPYVFFAGTADINAPPGSRSTSHPPHPHKKNNTAHNPPPTPVPVPKPHPPINTPLKLTQPTQIKPTDVSQDSREGNSTGNQTLKLPDVEFQPQSSKPAESSSSSSDSSSDSEDTSSGSSSDVDDALFDILENTPSQMDLPAVVPPQTSSPTVVPPQTSSPTVVPPQTSSPTVVPPQTTIPTVVSPQTSSPTVVPPQTTTPSLVLPQTSPPVMVQAQTSPPIVVPPQTSPPLAAVPPQPSQINSTENENVASGGQVESAEAATSVSTEKETAMIGIETTSPENETTMSGTKIFPENETQLESSEKETAMSGTGTTQIETKVPKENIIEDMDTEPPNDQEVILPTEVPSTMPDKVKKINDPDKFLLHLSDILERVHKSFYSEYDAMSKQSGDLSTPDLKQIIPKMRQSVLRGAKILFTGVIPTNMPPEKSPEWNTARAFGASIHDRFVYGLTSSNPKKAMHATTHVIAGRPGTSKLREAKRISGIKVVSPKWLWRCAEQWKLVDEREFPVQFEDEKEKVEKAPIAKVPKIASQRNRTGAKKKDIKLKTQPEEEVFDNDIARPVSVPNPAVVREEQRVPERHMSIESCLSVSDEELDRMNAEVDAEISASSSDSSSEEETPVGPSELGTLVEVMDDDDSLSYDHFTGINSSGSRKRKHEDVSSSSDNSPASLGLLDESLDVSEREGSGSDSGDELAALLGT